MSVCVCVWWWWWGCVVVTGESGIYACCRLVMNMEVDMLLLVSEDILLPTDLIASSCFVCKISVR